jgi:hypothetical protein
VDAKMMKEIKKKKAILIKQIKTPQLTVINYINAYFFSPKGTNLEISNPCPDQESNIVH